MAPQTFVHPNLLAALATAQEEVTAYAAQVWSDPGLKTVVTYLDNGQQGSSEGLRIHPGQLLMRSGKTDLFLRFRPLKTDEIVEPCRDSHDDYGLWSRNIASGGKCSRTTQFTYLTPAQVGAHYERFGGVRRMQETLEESLRSAGKIVGYQGEVTPALETTP